MATYLRSGQGRCTYLQTIKCLVIHMSYEKGYFDADGLPIVSTLEDDLDEELEGDDLDEEWEEDEDWGEDEDFGEEEDDDSLSWDDDEDEDFDDEV